MSLASTKKKKVLQLGSLKEPFCLEQTLKFCENHSFPFSNVLIELNGRNLNFWLQKMPYLLHEYQTAQHLEYCHTDVVQWIDITVASFPGQNLSKFPAMNMTNTSLSVAKIKTFTAAPLDIQLPVQMGIMVDSYSEAATGEIWTCCSTQENNIIIL